MSTVDGLLHWYETLSKNSVDLIKNFYSTDAFFKDPFNELTGPSSIKHIFDDMFLNLENPRFIFIDRIEQDNQAFVTWDFVFGYKNTLYTIRGSSHLKLNDDQLIIYHRDYWDVGEELLLKIPVIKIFYGALRNKLAHKKE